MSYSGRNFDIVTGGTALLVAWLVATGRGGRRLVLTWNVLGLALLLNIVTPAVMVLVALAGHLIVFRAISR